MDSPALPKYEAVREAIPGAQADFETVYGDEFSYVYRALLRLGIREADVEDVAHDVFVAVHRQLPSFDCSRPIRPWLFSFAFRAASGHKQLSRHRHEIQGIEVDVPTTTPLADEQLQGEQARKTVHDVLATIEIERRAVLVMHDLEGHSVPEIATALAVPLNTAYSRLRLARRDFERGIRRLPGGAP